jgi:hypothetical protein
MSAITSSYRATRSSRLAGKSQSEGQARLDPNSTDRTSSLS